MEETSNSLIAKNIEKFTDLIVEPVKQKTAHPFVSSYLISSLFLNWKLFFILLFSAKAVEEKIIYIDNLYSNGWDIFWKIAIPLIIAFFYTVGIKHIDQLIDFLNQKPVQARINNRASIEILTLQQEIGIVQAHIRLNNARAENKDLEELNNKIKSLNDEVEAKDKAIDGLLNSVDNWKAEIATLNSDLSEIKAENFNITSNALKSIDKERNLESLIALLFDAMDKNKLISILETIPLEGIPENIRQLSREIILENPEQHNFKTLSIEVNNDVSEEKLNVINKELHILNDNIDATLMHITKDRIRRKMLDIRYPSFISSVKISGIIDSHINN